MYLILCVTTIITLSFTVRCIKCAPLRTCPRNSYIHTCPVNFKFAFWTLIFLDMLWTQYLRWCLASLVFLWCGSVKNSKLEIQLYVSWKRCISFCFVPIRTECKYVKLYNFNGETDILITLFMYWSKSVVEIVRLR